jgi:hypothetical protein
MVVSQLNYTCFAPKALTELKVLTERNERQYNANVKGHNVSRSLFIIPV